MPHSVDGELGNASERTDVDGDDRDISLVGSVAVVISALMTVLLLVDAVVDVVPVNIFANGSTCPFCAMSK